MLVSKTYKHFGDVM